MPCAVVSCATNDYAERAANAVDSYEHEIVGTDLADMLEGTPNPEKIVGKAGGDLLRGEGGEDTFVGGAGGDMLDGGIDSDTYIFAVGDGPDTVADAGGSADRVIFTGGTAVDDMIVTVEPLGFLLTRLNTNDSVFIWDWGPDGGPIEHFVFADGQLSADEVESRVSGNRHPEAVGAIPPQVAKVGQRFEFALPREAFSDPNVDDELIYRIRTTDPWWTPTWLGFDRESLVLYGTPGAEDLGEVMLRFVAIDSGYLEAAVELKITVVE